MTTRKADWSKRTANKTPGTTVELDDTVLVPATPDVAWARLEDVALVASCLPGLDPVTLVHEGDGVFKARMTNTVMGISANWDLRATIRPDSERRVLNVILDGEDRKLNMKLKGTASVAVRGEGVSQSVLDYTANLRIDGTLAAMGGPVVRSILSDAIAQFVGVVGGEEHAQDDAWHVRLRAALRNLWRRLADRASAIARNRVR